MQTTLLVIIKNRKVDKKYLKNVNTCRKEHVVFVFEISNKISFKFDFENLNRLDLKIELVLEGNLDRYLDL